MALFLLLLLLLVPRSNCVTLEAPEDPGVPKSDVDLLEFPLNLEYLEAELFLYASLGYGLDKVAPDLAEGGPPPVGAKAANLSTFVKDIVLQFAYQEVGHLKVDFDANSHSSSQLLGIPFVPEAKSCPHTQSIQNKAIKKTVKGFPRPLLNLSPQTFAAIFDKAFATGSLPTALPAELWPPFDPYANDINFLLAAYLVPYVGLTGYVGANPKLQGSVSKRLVAGLLGVESGQDAVIRALLYQQVNQRVDPYGNSVEEFTLRISGLRNELSKADGYKDEGLVVPLFLGAEKKIKGNVLAGDKYSLAYDRTPEEILRIVYGSGNASVPGGFFPNGGNGNIAKSHLPSA